MTRLPSVYYLSGLYLLFVGLVGFLSMGWDKLMAKRNKRRVPERTLLLIAAFGGSLGSILGMELFRHKTRHRKFTWGLPAILLLQCILLFFVLAR